MEPWTEERLRLHVGISLDQDSPMGHLVAYVPRERLEDEIRRAAVERGIDPGEALIQSFRVSQYI